MPDFFLPHNINAAVVFIVVRKKQLQETEIVTNVTAIEISWHEM